MDDCGGCRSAKVSKIGPTITLSEYARKLNAVSSVLRSALAPGVLVILPGSSPGKLQFVAEAFDEQVFFISVGRFLTQALLEEPRGRRAQKALNLLSEKLRAGPCCFYDIEILFDSYMKLSVLAALRTLAKGRELYVDWPGEWKAEEQCLTFAEPEDPAYRAYPVDAEIGVVDLSGETYPALEF